MKSTVLFSLLLAWGVVFSGCEEEKKRADLPLTFKAFYDGQALTTGKNYAYGNTTIRFTRFSFYVSPIEVLQDGDADQISDAQYLQFTDSTNGIIRKTFTAPEGNCTGIRLGFGVEPSLNKKRPSDFASNHPLYLENEYWLDWKSYIFAKLEGYVDTDGNGEPESFFIYHSGSDASYYTADYQKNFTVGNNNGLNIEIDVKKIFTFNGQLFDLSARENRVTPHDVNDIALGKKILGNYASAVSVK